MHGAIPPFHIWHHGMVLLGTQRKFTTCLCWTFGVSGNVFSDVRQENMTVAAVLSKQLVSIFLQVNDCMFWLQTQCLKKWTNYQTKNHSHITQMSIKNTNNYKQTKYQPTKEERPTKYKVYSLLSLAWIDEIFLQNFSKETWRKGANSESREEIILDV
jgi:hypothetical protein